MDRQRFLLPALALITVWRMALLPTLELSPDEALAALYSRHLGDAWHLEMGPLVPWLARLGTMVAGGGEFGVRFFAPLCAFAVTVGLWRLCRGLFDATTAGWAVVLLQVLPGFNLAAVTMSSSIAGLAAVTGLVLALRIALHRPSPWHSSWWLAALCLLLAMLADWRNGLAYFCCVLALGLPRRRRHHLWAPGGLLLAGAFALGALWFLRWNLMHGWPVLQGGGGRPVWTVLPNILRWIVLASPLLLTLAAWALERTWRRESHVPDIFFTVAFALPYAVLDFGWGPLERWPHTGFLLWLVLGTGLLAHHSLMSLQMPTRSKVVLRTLAAVIGALMSMVIMRTDLLRYLGLPWPMQQRSQPARQWQQFFVADPASDMQGWREGAKLLAGMLYSSRNQEKQDVFVIAADWRIGVPLAFYLPPDTPMLRPSPDHPRVQALQQPGRANPLSLWPRYDSLHGTESAFRDHDALYVTDNAKAAQPPALIRNAFERTQLLSVAKVMHSGHEVRTLKIFACHRYKPPDL